MIRVLIMLLTCLASLQGAFYQFDNETIADYDQIADDPFLVIRTKRGGKETPYDLAASWYQYSFYSPFKNQTLPVEKLLPVLTENTLPSVVFDHRSPEFEVQEGEKVWWQIARDVSFTSILPNCERVEGSISTIRLDSISETFLSSQKTYFFRYRVWEEDAWNEWSDTVAFTFLRPIAPANIAFDKIADNRFEISWTGQEGVNYWIFASNALDFMPSIYASFQPNVLTESKLIAAEPNENLYQTTSDTTITVDGTYAYYRIVAEQDQCFSVPSPLIYVYDVGIKHRRTVLQQKNHPVLASAQRILFPADHLKSEIQSSIYNVEANTKPPAVDPTVWERVSPYLMPLNHPIRAKLDRLFSASRVLLDAATLEKAGFKETEPGRYSKAVVSENKHFKDYVFKLFLDSQPNLVDWEQWVRRASGAISARARVRELGFQKHIVVPHKWIYPLPSAPGVPPGYHQKYFILVAEKIDIHKRDKNYAMWKDKMTKERLRAIFLLLKTEQLTDSNRAFNFPFAKDGRNALIDIEHHHTGHVYYDALKRWLSPSMQAYLDELKATLGT